MNATLETIELPGNPNLARKTVRGLNPTTRQPAMLITPYQQKEYLQRVVRTTADTQRRIFGSLDTAAASDVRDWTGDRHLISTPVGDILGIRADVLGASAAVFNPILGNTFTVANAWNAWVSRRRSNCTKTTTL